MHLGAKVGTKAHWANEDSSVRACPHAVSKLSTTIERVFKAAAT